LIIPALSSSVQSAKISTSISNLRQIYVAAIQYANDNNGEHVRVSNGPGSTWVQELWKITYPDSDFPGYGHALEGSIYYTPLIEEAANARTFGLNSHIASRHPTLRLSLLPHASEIAYMGDTKTSSGFAVSQFNPRNFGKVNVLFLDGHVESVPEDEIPTDIRAYFWTALLDNYGQSFP